ncbi:MAG: sulfatase [Bryobacter sp.]|nr:sulfatase [Bryobacter sp.]
MLNRRHFLAALGSAPFAKSALAQAAPMAKNCLFISSDDLCHAFSTYGHPLVKTPNLDRLAGRGVRFDNAYCQFPLCSPSRTSLMTGLAPDRTGVYDLKKHFRESVPNVVTLGQLFQQNDAYAARVGKIYHYGNPRDIGTNGLDDAPTWNERYNPRGIDKEEEPLVTNHTPGKGLGSAAVFYSSPASDEQHTDGMVAARSVELLEKHRREKFFIAAGFYRPHCPWIAPTKYFDQVPLSKVEPLGVEEWELKVAPALAYWTKPANWGMTYQQRKEALQAYYASILFLDAQVGKLLDAMDRLQLWEDTLVVFWSDHGYQLGEKGQWMKQSLFEPSARTPMLMAGAGVSARGKACRRTVELLDVYPTVADLCGLRGTPQDLDGTSLRKLLAQPAAKWERPAISQTGRGKLMGYSIRTETHRYTMWDAGREGEELYNYTKDPRANKNLAAEAGQAGLKAKLRAELETVVRKRGGKV